jgi:signal transduction histidine kinase
MTDRLRTLADEYSVALEQYVSQPDETALARAYELGRRALTDGLGVLDVATVHSRALPALLVRPTSEHEPAKLLEALEMFLVEALSPFEMTFLSFRESNAVLHRVNDVLEGQARRIASALHDEAAQLLASVHLALADMAVKQPGTAKPVQNIRGLLEQIEDRLRHLSHELRPPILDDLGLVPALEFLAESMSKRWGLGVAVQASLTDGLPATVETTLYRIAQEALNNVVKHAKATRACVSVRREPRRVACSIRDDGIGFNPAAATTRTCERGLGLMEIQERVVALGGALRLGRNDGGGTDLTVEIPLE